ncbi:hypothetical protein KBH77_01480 [Patescibacteria group bacterium]|nr:hypothetical protein [Patescibacteria group bacterium]
MKKNNTQNNKKELIINIIIMICLFLFISLFTYYLQLYHFYYGTSILLQTTEVLTEIVIPSYCVYLLFQLTDINTKLKNKLKHKFKIKKYRFLWLISIFLICSLVLIIVLYLEYFNNLGIFEFMFGSICFFIFFIIFIWQQLVFLKYYVGCNYGSGR